MRGPQEFGKLKVLSHEVLRAEVAKVSQREVETSEKSC
jgi:hypothetical protein